MKKIFTSILILVSVVSFSACNFTKFDGSRTGNESQLIMQYDVLNMTDSQKLKLAAGDILRFDVVSQSGSVDIQLQKGEEDPIYEGTDIPTSAFQVVIQDDGTYTVSVTGKKAKGSVSVIKEDAEDSTSIYVLPLFGDRPGHIIRSHEKCSQHKAAPCKLGRNIVPIQSMTPEQDHEYHKGYDVCGRDTQINDFQPD